MSKIKNPIIKKAVSYRKDHPVRPGVEYPKASRKSMPRKKTWSHRQFRRVSKRMLLEETATQRLLNSEEKRILKKYNIFSRGAPLRSVVAWKKQNLYTRTK